MYIGGQMLKNLTPKIHNILNIKPISLELWFFTNFNMGFPVILFVFDLDEFSEGVQLLKPGQTS
jgi:hypothetical protein